MATVDELKEELEKLKLAIAGGGMKAKPLKTEGKQHLRCQWGCTNTSDYHLAFQHHLLRFKGS